MSPSSPTNTLTHPSRYQFLDEPWKVINPLFIVSYFLINIYRMRNLVVSKDGGDFSTPSTFLSHRRTALLIGSLSRTLKAITLPSCSSP